ncbi:DNA-binding winged helix-turn-helix (wHTH) protein [Tahibacter aquaticus]|uniref:DNA-binding winged helix-turn-helix (WHTH) protein n=1 Tax=Tahibacter aquaticus TaxID=520092 RepID=A0A4R6YYP2_9GAMM|nr:winged helix-turn-helix domain-containing protein [Tahibacter aquaticus]TDR44154.1 DNA-binding winged helix-turn-helix (wHTH) protein [Tahibacter aquaticus]
MLYRFADVCLDSASRLICGPDGPVTVPKRVFDCLAYLVEHRDRAVARDELILHVWNRPNVSDTQLAQTVLRARRLLADDGVEQRLIRTVPGFGYHWVGPVQVVETAEDAAAAPEEPVPAVESLALSLPDIASAPADSMPPAAAVLLAAGSLPMARPSRRSERRRIGWSLAAIAAIALLVLLSNFVPVYLPAGASAAATTGKIIVLPVEIEAAAGTDSAWARLGLMDLIAARLRAEGLVVPPSESVLAALAAARENRIDLPLRPQDLRAELLIQPRLSRLASGWQLSLEGRRANGIDLALQQQHAQILDAAVAASDALLASLGRARGSERTAQDETALRVRAGLLGNELDSIREWLQALPPAQRMERNTRYLAAELDYRAGRLAESRSALDALLLDPHVDEDATFRGRVLVARGSIAMRQRDYSGSEKDFAAAIAALDGTTAGRDLGRALMGRGGIALQQLRLEQAGNDLSRARDLLDAAGDDLGVARAEVNLALLQRRGGRPLEALEQLQAAATRFGNYAAINELSATLAGIIDLQCSLLRWDDALASSERAQLLLARLPDKQLRARLLQGRIEVLTGLGRLSEAQQALDSLALVGASGSGEIARGALLAAELALARGEPVRAAQLAQPLLALAQSADTRESAFHAAALLQRARPELAQQDLLPGIAPEAEPRDCVQAIIVRARRLQGQQRNAEAETLLRRGLALTLTSRDLREQRSVAEVLSALLLQQGRSVEAMEALAPLALLVPRDFDTALLFAGLHREMADINAWQFDLHKAAALAGERTLPQHLTAPLIAAGAATPAELAHATP